MCDKYIAMRAVLATCRKTKIVSLDLAGGAYSASLGPLAEFKGAYY